MPPTTVATKPYKAVAAFVLTILGLLWASLAGKDTLDDMTLMEWLSIIVPVILTTGAVYGITNPPKAPQE